MTLKRIEVGSTEYQEALRLRADVLRTPLGLSLTQAELAQERLCFHLGGFDESRLVAVLLLQPLDAHTVKMRQVAVSPARQRSGAGAQLIAFAETFAREHGYRTIVAHARGTAVGFYLRLGYTAAGDEFLEQTIPHRRVTKTVIGAGRAIVASGSE
jgi:predicted GNAT family N-acyltransferase